jgi:diguanylate cyclase (GGDEF)-like protein
VILQMSPAKGSFWTNFPAMAAYLAGCIATLALLGWIFHIPVLTTVLPGWSSMKPNAAIGLLLLVAALRLATPGHFPRLQGGLAMAATLAGAVTLFEYFSGYQLGIDQWLFRDAVQTRYPGRMSLVTAVNFVLLALALLPVQRRSLEVLREGLALGVVLTSTFAVVGYLYGIPLFYGAVAAGASRMAIHTALAFMLLATGFLFIPRENGIMRIFRGNSIASMVARFLVPVALFGPVLLGAIFMHRRLNMGHMSYAMALSVVSNVVLLVALIWYFSFVIQRTEIERAALRRQTQHDPLTGIYNRCYFDTALEHEVERSRRYATPLSLIMFDLDDFKQLNDRYGHLSGDRALLRVARQCEQHLRATDIFCRYGGEEFIIIAPETTSHSALMLARRIREGIATVILDGPRECITVSTGVATWGKDFQLKEDLIAAADHALYQAKRSGKNCDRLYGAAQIKAASSAD